MSNTREAETRTVKNPQSQSPFKHAWKNHQDPYSPIGTEQAFPYTLIIYLERLTLGLSHQQNQLLKISPECDSNYRKSQHMQKQKATHRRQSIIHYKDYSISSYLRESIIFGMLFITSSVFSTNILIMTQHVTGHYTIFEKAQKVSFFSNAVLRNRASHSRYQTGCWHTGNGRQDIHNPMRQKQRIRRARDCRSHVLQSQKHNTDHRICKERWMARSC